MSEHKGTGKIEAARVVEEIETGLDAMAAIMGAFFKELLQQGFTREEALLLVRNWQLAVMGRNRPEDEE